VVCSSSFEGDLIDGFLGAVDGGQLLADSMDTAFCLVCLDAGKKEGTEPLR